MHDQSVSIFLSIRFSAYNEPAGFDGKLWLMLGGGGDQSNDESVLTSIFRPIEKN